VCDSCAQQYAHKYEQFLKSCLVTVRLVFVCFKGLVCILVSCVSLDHFDCVLLVFFGGGVQYRAERLAGKNVSEMTYFVSSGTSNLTPSIHRYESTVTGNNGVTPIVPASSVKTPVATCGPCVGWAGAGRGRGGGGRY